MHPIAAVQSTVIEHREARDDTGACVGCQCGERWPADDALLAYGQHLAVALVEALMPEPVTVDDYLSRVALAAADHFERSGGAR